jgi:hypothetical protein
VQTANTRSRRFHSEEQYCKYHMCICKFRRGRTLSGTRATPSLAPAVRSITLPMIVGNAIFVPEEITNAIIATAMLPPSGFAAAISFINAFFFLGPTAMTTPPSAVTTAGALDFMLALVPVVRKWRVRGQP